MVDISRKFIFKILKASNVGHFCPLLFPKRPAKIHFQWQGKMRIDFLKNVGIPAENAPQQHLLLLEEHLYHTRTRDSHSACYTKILLSFALSVPVLFAIHSRISSTETTYLVAGAIIIGICLLTSCLWPTLYLFKYDHQIAQIIAMGETLEKAHPSLIPTTIFHAFAQADSYRATLLTRFLPFVLVFSEITWMGIALSLKLSLWLACSAATIAIMILSVSVFLLSKASKNHAALVLTVSLQNPH